MSLAGIERALEEETLKRHWRGTHRVRAPEQTLEIFGRHRRSMGITRLANVTGLDRLGFPVCVAVRPNARSLATSQGKGETLAAAMVSAMMESTELWHAERVSLPIRYEAHHGFSDEELSTPADQLPVRIDADYDPGRPISWVQGWDLVASRPRWVPLELVSINLVRQPGVSAIFVESTNGLSSGNHLAEAMVHGLCEVVERDAVALWELFGEKRRKDRQVDLATIEDGAVAGLIEDLARKGVVSGLWDVTSDVGVPTYTAVIVEDTASRYWRPIPPFFGHGCHPDPVVAASRALHEAVQSRLTVISGSRDDMFNADYVRTGNRDDHERLLERLLAPAARSPFGRSSFPIGRSCQEDLRTLIEALVAVGIDSVVAVDLGRADLGIPVVRMIVPGLEPYSTALSRPGPRSRRLAKAFAA